MSEDIAKLGLYVDSSGVVRATKHLRKLEGQSKRNVKSNAGPNKSFGLMKTALVGLGAPIVLKKFISTAAAFETMKVSLETVTGSAEKAEAAFDGITKFASETPFSVEEVTQSFIKLKALGIDPTEANLKSFGNTSSAMGKSLNQMIEAVADAATGEFERLKEFGIKATKQGDRATFTFKGVTTTVKNSSQEITKYLQKLGEDNFGDGMKKQMDTVNGAFSNAGDAVDGLATALGEAGLNSVVKTLTLSFAELVSNIADAFKEGDSARILEKQIDTIQERIFTLQSSIENQQSNNFFEDLLGGSVDTSLQQIERLEKQLDGFQERLAALKKEGKSGIDTASKSDDSNAQAAIEAENAKNKTLMETSENFQRLHAAQVIQAKQTEIEKVAELEQAAKDRKVVELEEVAELERIAGEQRIVEQATAEAVAIKASEQQREARNAAVAQTFSTLAVLMSSSSKKMFKIGKTAAMASAIINSAQAVTKTMTATPYPWNIPLAAAQAAAGLVQVQNIRAQKFSGQAHDGMDYVPRTGSYVLEEGEAVIKKKEAGKIRAGDVSGGSNANITFSPVVQAFDAEDVMQNKDKLFNGFRDQFVEWMYNEGLTFQV